MSVPLYPPAADVLSTTGRRDARPTSSHVSAAGRAVVPDGPIALPAVTDRRYKTHNAPSHPPKPSTDSADFHRFLPDWISSHLRHLRNLRIPTSAPSSLDDRRSTHDAALTQLFGMERRRFLGILALAIGFVSNPAIAQTTIWTNPITGTNPNTSNPYTTGQTISNNLTVSGIGRGTGITSSNTIDRYNASGWNTASLDTNDYFYFTLTPENGFKIDFSSFVYTSQASGSGPTSFAFRSSLDSYAADIATPTSIGATISLSGASYQTITSEITFRIYGWGASASGGTFSVNDFSFNGSVASASAFTTWTGTGSAGTWSNGTPGSFVGNYANDLANTVTFTGTGGTVTASGPVQAGSLVFNADSYILAGSLQLGVGSITTTGSISTNVTANISGSGSSGLTKAGAGTLVLSGSNSYTGATSLNAGTLVIGNDNAFGSAGNITFSGGTLQYGSGITADLSSRIKNSGSAIIVDTNNNNITFGTALDANNTGGLTKQGAGTLTLSVSNTLNGPLQVTGGTLNLSGGTLTINTGSASTISGALSGSGNLTKSGAGNLMITNNNSGYSGETRLEGGVLVIGNNGALGTGTVTFRDAGTIRSTDATDRTLSLAIGTFTGGNNTVYTFGSTATGNLTFSGTGSTSLGSVTRNLNILNNTTTFGQSFTNTGAITKSGPGTLILTGNSTYSGATTINAGTLQLGNGGTTGSLNATSTITNNATLAFNRSDDITQGTNFNSVISGTGAVIQSGSGSLFLSGANAYTGTTNINSGIIRASHNTALGTTAGGVTVASGAALELTGGITIGAEALALSGNGISNGGALRNISGDNTYQGAITLNAASRINSDSGLLTLSGNIGGADQNLTIGGSGNTTISGAIATGTGTLTKADAGTLTLSGSNAYSGNTTVAGGTLVASAANALGSTSRIDLTGGSLLVTAENAVNDNANINLAGGKLAMSGNFSETVGALTLSADSIIDFASFSGTLRFGSIAAWTAGAKLSVWNWAGSTQYGTVINSGRDSNLVFTTGNATVANISFYSDSGSSLIANGFQQGFTGVGGGNEIIAVPEPETYITGVLLLLGFTISQIRLAREGRGLLWRLSFLRQAAHRKPSGHRLA